MRDYLAYLVKEIHSVVLATTDTGGRPVTCVIDMMLSDDKGLYFLTARGKSFYERLKQSEHVSLSGFTGDDTMSSKSVTVRGRAKEVGDELLPEIFKQNPYMKDIYPNEQSRKALTVFQIHEGDGEFFDLSVRPIFRESFSFGKELQSLQGYFTCERCIACGKCIKVCPQSCITIKGGKAKINQSSCLHCGICLETCPIGAIERL